MPHFEAILTLYNSPQSFCGMCFSLNLNKSSSYLSLFLSLNSFRDETSRTWAILSPETRFHGFQMGSRPSHMCSSPKLGFGWLKVPTPGFKSQAGVCLGLSPSTWVQVPVWDKWFQKQWQTLFSWAPKSLWTLTAAKKLKDACSLEENLWQT